MTNLVDALADIDVESSEVLLRRALLVERDGHHLAQVDRAVGVVPLRAEGERAGER